MKILSLERPLQVIKAKPDFTATFVIESSLLDRGIEAIKEYFNTIKESVLGELDKEEKEIVFLQFVCNKNTSDADYTMLFDIIAAMVPPMFLTDKMKTDEKVIIKDEILAETSIDTVTMNKFARQFSIVKGFNAGLQKEDEEFIMRVVG